MDPWQAHYMAQAQAQAQAQQPQQTFYTPGQYFVPLTPAAPPPMQMFSAPPPAPPPAAFAQMPLTKPEEMNGIMSRKYRDIHPVLASDSSAAYYDARASPSDFFGSSGDVVQYLKVNWAVAGVDKIMLYSPDFPWSIEIHRAVAGGIPIWHVFEGLHVALQEPIVDSEWGMISNYLSKHMRERIQKAAEERRAYEKRYVKDKAKFKGMRRIDFLGDAAIFLGVDKDDGYVKKRLCPGSDAPELSLVVRMGPRP